MSKTTKNNKNLLLENTIVSYSAKDDTIHITSADPDLHGKPFHISLNQSTPTENTLRELLADKGIISKELIGSQLPTFKTLDLNSHRNPEKFVLGESRFGETVWEPLKDSHLGIYGNTGSGKTAMAKNILHQASDHQDFWNIHIVNTSSDSPEYDLLRNRLTNAHAYADNPHDVEETIEHIYNKMLNSYEEKKKHNSVEESSQKTLLVIDDFGRFGYMFDSNSYEQDSQKTVKALYQLKQIIRNGREAGIYVVHASHNPFSTDQDILLNTPSRIVIGRVVEETSKTALNSNSAVRTPKIRGRGFYTFDNDIPVQFQAYYGDFAA